ncbi:transposase [Candidatus Parcubacteria bacterium]|nr:transposase [Candidatus Parcubacteria bacterium]
MNTKKRVLNPNFKFQVVMEILQNQQKQVEIARQYDLSPRVVCLWKKQFLQQGPGIFAHSNQDKQQDRKVEELETLIGRQTIEIQFLKKVLSRLD